jgi:beta-mannosidase
MKKTITIFLLLFSAVQNIFSQKTSNTVELGNDWEYTHFPYCRTDREALDKARNSDLWKQAAVPGTVQMDLQRNGVLDDLYYGQNFYNAVWAESEDFVYRTTFRSPDLSGGKRLYLDFDGLDCFATIWINNRQAGKTHNMFKTYSFDVTDDVKPGENLLTIRLAAPMKEAYNYPDAQKVMDSLEGAFNIKERLITRKVQMNYAWDNVPRIITTGVYRPVKLRVCEAAKIDNVWFRTELSGNYSTARAKVTVELLPVKDFTGEMEVKLTRNGKEYVKREKVSVKSSGTVSVIHAEIPVKDPELWWPAGLGGQPLYRLTVNLIENGNVKDSYAETVGIREIKAVTTPAGKRMVNYRIGNPGNQADILDGGITGAWSKVRLPEPREVEVTPLKFFINGKYVFLKGFNIQPLDVFEQNITREKYFRTVKMAKEIGSNMLRVWGGGNVENPAFYDACDESGILVWQDFFYASGQYPNDDHFLTEIEGETVNVVKRLRNRTCLAAWCGDNESDMVNHDQGRGQFYNKISHVVQKRILAQYDPDRYWHPSSPSGGGYPRSPWGGDKRNWGAAYPANDYEHIRGDEGRFISEGGCPSMPTLHTWQKYIPEHARWPMNSDYYFMHWGDTPRARRNFPETVTENIITYFGIPGDLSEMVYLSHVSQAHGLQRMAQHFRRNMDECGGVLMWKWADTWPSICYSIIDYEEYRKPAWYSVKRAFAPTTVFVENKHDVLTIDYLNDSEEQKAQKVCCQLKNCDGTLVKEWTETVDFKAGSAGVAIDLSIRRTDYGTGEYYIKTWIEGNSSAPYYYPLSSMAGTKTIPGKVSVSATRIDRSRVELAFTADEFTPYVAVYATNPYIIFSDNAFYLEKGETKKITLTAPEGELWADLTYRWWKGKPEHLTIGSEYLPAPKQPGVSYP